MSSSAGSRTRIPSLKRASHRGTAGSSRSYSRKSAPPLLLESHGSRTQSTIVFCLHLFALSALFGASAHLLHCLINEINPQQVRQSTFFRSTDYTSDNALAAKRTSTRHDTITPSPFGVEFNFERIPVTDANITREVESPGLFRIVALAVVVLLTAFVTMLAILRSAVNAHNDACKRLSICWNPDGTLSLRSSATVNNLPLAANEDHLCLLQPGSYNSHWLVILRCCLVSSRAEQVTATQNSKRFCILLARDSLTFESFRHLRLWMRLVAPRQLTKLNSHNVSTKQQTTSKQSYRQ